MIIMGMGSNMGDRLRNLENAYIRLSSEIQITHKSSVYETKALLMSESPKEWDINYYNMVLIGKTTKTPFEMLKIAKEIENQLGRKHRGYWSPREIDVDILDCNDFIVRSKELHIPHKEMLNRDFTVIPLAEIAPDMIYGTKTISEIAKDFTGTGIVKTDFVVGDEVREVA